MKGENNIEWNNGSKAREDYKTIKDLHGRRTGGLWQTKPHGVIPSVPQQQRQDTEGRCEGYQHWDEHTLLRQNSHRVHQARGNERRGRVKHG